MAEFLTCKRNLKRNFFCFQPSQRSCECEDGYEEISNSLDCKQKTYGICGEDTWRNDKGNCWNETQWLDYCSSTVSFLKCRRVYGIKMFFNFLNTVNTPLSPTPLSNNTNLIPPFFRGRKLICPLSFEPPPLPSPTYSSLINDRLC